MHKKMICINKCETEEGVDRWCPQDLRIYCSDQEGFRLVGDYECRSPASKSYTSGKAGGLENSEPLKAVENREPPAVATIQIFSADRAFDLPFPVS